MSSSKRPSTSSLRRFITSRPYVPVAEIRRRFGLDEPDCVCMVERDGVSAFVGLPERESVKLQDLWSRGEVGLELSVEVHAPVVVGVYPMRIARYVMDGNPNGQHANGQHGNGHHPHPGNGHGSTNGTVPYRATATNGNGSVAPKPAEAAPAEAARAESHPPEPPVSAEH